MKILIAAPLLALCGGCSDSLPPVSGAVIWSVSGSSAGTPAFDAANAYFLTTAHEVVALDKRDGALRWRRSTGMRGDATSGRAALVVGNAVVAGDGDVHAFDRDTGARLWQFHPAAGYLPGLFQLATDGLHVFAGSPSGHVYAIDAAGRQKWMVDLKDNALDISAFGPVYADGRVFVCFTRFGWPRTGGIAALDAATGRVIWRVDFPARPPNHQGGCYAQAAVTGAIVVGATHDGHVYALDRVSGEHAWSAPQLTDVDVNDTGSPQMDIRPVAAGEGIVVVGSTTSWVVGLDAGTGTELWRSSPRRGSVIFPIEVSGGAAYTVGGALELTAFDVRTGAVRWSRGADGDMDFVARPSIDGDRLYIGGPNHLSALRR